LLFYLEKYLSSKKYIVFKNGGMGLAKHI